MAYVIDQFCGDLVILYSDVPGFGGTVKEKKSVDVYFCCNENHGLVFIIIITIVGMKTRRVFS